MVYKKKQFRANLCEIKFDEKEKSKDLFKEHESLKDFQTETIRFKQERLFAVDDQFDVVVSNIFEVRETEADFKQEFSDLREILAKNDKKELDLYIISKIEKKNKEKRNKHEAEMRVSEVGNAKMLKMDRYQLNQYIGNMFMVNYGFGLNQMTKLEEEMRTLSMASKE